MKIVISGYVGKKVTGIGRNLICLLNHTGENNQYVVYTNADMADEIHFTNPGVTVKTYSVSKMNSMMNLLWTTFVFPFVVRKEKADKALIPNFTLLLFKFCPTLVIMHDLIEFHIPDKFSKLKMFYRTKLADPITARRADQILTVSENSKKDIVGFLKIPEEKIHIVYNGVDQNLFFPVPLEKAEAVLHNRNLPAHFLLYVGTIDYPGKNTMGLIKGFEILKRAGRYSGGVVLAGMPGSGFETVAQYIEKSDYRDSIFLTGYVSDCELAALYSACDVFAFLSFYEGFGIPPLEALACGAKIVVSNTSSLPEVVGNAGWMADPKSAEDIADKVDEALKRPKDADYVRKAELQLKKFDWVKQATAFESELQRGASL